MRSLGMGSKRLAATLAGALMALGLIVGAAQSQRFAGSTSIELMTDGPGVLEITPAETEETARCKVDAQQYVDADTGEQTLDPTPCVHHLDPGTKVTLTAVPDEGHTFVGWSDFACSNKSKQCTLKLAPGTRYVAARFSPVTLTLFTSGDFGVVSVNPKPLKSCDLNTSEPCVFKSGTRITLSREFASDDKFWVGPCDGNDGGVLDDDTCTLKLLGNEAVGAGYDGAGAIPPVLGSGIAVVVSGRGKVTGTVINRPEKLNCGSQCTMTGLTRYNQVQLKAVLTSSAYKFSRWSNGSPIKTQTIPISSTNRIQAVFVRK